MAPSPLFAAILLSLTTACFQPGNPPETLEPKEGWKKLGRSLWFDPEARTLIVKAKVVLREGPLEHLVCLKGTKEHEAVLSTDAVPRQIHAGLLLTGLKPGHPVTFTPRLTPPAGDATAITAYWREKGKEHTIDARDFVLDDNKKTPLRTDWVFAGSQLFFDKASNSTKYAADDGDLITVANFGSAILDLPFASSADDTERVFVANPKVVPPLGTEVFLTLGPRKPQDTKAQPQAKTRP